VDEASVQIAVVSNTTTSNSSSNSNTDSSKSSASDTSFEAERSVGEECEDLASFSPTYVYSGDHSQFVSSMRFFYLLFTTPSNNNNK
jgi:hypothetical protein